MGLLGKVYAADLLKQHVLVFSTDVDKVSLNLGTPEQEDIDRMTRAECRRYLDEQGFLDIETPMLTKATMVDGRSEVGIMPTGVGLGVIDEAPPVAGGDQRSIAHSLSNLGNIQADRGRFSEALNCHQEALELRL